MTIKDARLAEAEVLGEMSSSVIHQAVLAAAGQANLAPALILDYGSGSGQLSPLLAQALPDAALHAADIMDRPASLPPRVPAIAPQTVIARIMAASFARPLGLSPEPSGAGPPACRQAPREVFNAPCYGVMRLVFQ